MKKVELKKRIRPTTLLQELQVCSPALIQSPSCVPMSCFKLDGGMITTYNDELFMTTPLPSGVNITGCFEGKTLMSVLSLLPDKTLELEMENSKLRMRCGKSEVTLLALPIVDFPEPKMKKDTVVKYILDKNQTKAFAEAMQRMLASIASTCLEPDFRGAWVTPGEKHWTAVSSDGWRIGQQILEGKKAPVADGGKGTGDMFFVPLAMVETLSAMMNQSGTEESSLKITPTWVQVKVGDTIIRGRQVKPGEKMDNLADKFKSISEPAGDEKIVGIPDGAESLLRLSLITAEKQGQRKYTNFNVSGGTLEMLAVNSTTGEQVQHSDLLFEGHENRAASFDPELMLKALPFCDRMFFGDKAGVLLGSGYKYAFALRNISQ